MSEKTNTDLFYELIKNYPGMHMRELVRATEFSVGTTHYHLRKLKKKYLIVEEKIWRNKRYFSNDFPKEKRLITGLIRMRNVRNILEIINSKKLQHKEICRNIPLSPSTISWYLQKLVQKNIIIFEHNRYRLNNQKEIIDEVKTYQERYGEKLTDNFIEMWDI